MAFQGQALILTALRCLNELKKKKVDNSWDLNLPLPSFCFEKGFHYPWLPFPSKDGSLGKPKKGKRIWEEMGGDSELIFWGRMFDQMGRENGKLWCWQQAPFWLGCDWHLEASVGSQCPVGQGFLCLWVVVLIMWQLEGLIADKAGLMVRALSSKRNSSEKASWSVSLRGNC